MNNIPFENAYWVVPGKLLAGQIPAAVNATETKAKLEALKGVGITTVVNLMETTEKNKQGQPFYDYIPDLNQWGIETQRFPVCDLSVPSIVQMTAILDFIDAAHARGKGVYVHCWGGIGRTGTVVGCYLVRHQLANKNNVLAKIEALKSSSGLAHRISPETVEQREFVKQWETGR